MMTTTNVEMLVDVLSPGRVVYVRGGQTSHFGIACDRDFWMSKAHPSARKLCGDKDVPLLVLIEDLTWAFYFANKSSIIVQEGDLLSSDEELLRYCELFRCFTERDGSRYYRAFFKKLCDFGSISHETLSNNFLIRIPLQKIDQEFYGHLMKWKEENVVSKNETFKCTECGNTFGRHKLFAEYSVSFGESSITLCDSVTCVEAGISFSERKHEIAVNREDRQKLEAGGTKEVMQKTMELARDQLQNYRKPKEEIRSPGTTFP